MSRSSFRQGWSRSVVPVVAFVISLSASTWDLEASSLEGSSLEASSLEGSSLEASSLVEVKGRVTDQAKRPVGGAVVRAGDQTALTGPDGSFVLHSPVPVKELEISHPAFQRIRVATGREPARLEITLPPPSRKSEEVVVKAVRADPETPVTKTGMDREELEAKSTGQEIPELLKEVPSITYTSDTGTGNGYTYVSMRGIGPTRINFTLDGAPLNEPEDSTLYFVDFADLASSLSSLQVQRGVGTTSAGVASFAGSVNFASVDLSDSFQTSARMVLGSFGTKRATAGIQSGRLGDSGLKAYVRASYQSTDGFRDNSAILQKSVYAGLSHESDKGYFKFFGFIGDEKSQSAYYAVEPWILDENLTYNPLTEEEKDNFGQRFAQAQYTRFLSDETTLAGQLYVNDAGGWYRLWNSAKTALREYGLDWTNLGASLNYGTAFGSWRFTWGGHGSDFTSRRTRDVIGGERTYLNYGHKSEVSTFVKLAKQTGPLYPYGDVQVRWARFRYEGDLDLGSVSWTFVNPRIGVRRDLGSGVSAYISAGMTSREPGRGDLLSGEENATVVHDLTAVKPEKAVAIELGTTIARGPWNAQLNVYTMEFRDEIVLTGEQSEVGLSIRRNAGRSFRRGLEWDLSYRPSDPVSVRFTGNWSWNRIESWTQFYDVYDSTGNWTGSTSRTYQDVEPVLSPAFVGNLSVDASPLPWLGLGASVRHVSRGWLDNTNAGKLSTPGWWKVDASANFDLTGIVRAGNPHLRLLVDNVLDDHGIRPSGYSYLYATRDDAGRETLEGIPYLFPMATRSFQAVLDVSF
ncbi:MAG: TonB-dependent receptor [Acidobacteria bacterium]|nr:TonB-dependent receptor [Acidobacteriota bacterium]